MRQFLYFGFHQIGGFQSVGSGGQRDADAGSGMAVIKACDAVHFRAHGYTGHVAYMHALAAFRHFQKNVSELFGVGEQALRLDVEVQYLSVGAIDHVGTHLSGGHFRILGGHPGTDIRWSEAVFCHFVRIQPDAHDVLAAEDLNCTHTLRAADFILDVGADVVGKIYLVQAVIRRVQGDDHEHVVIPLGDFHTV